MRRPVTLPARSSSKRLGVHQLQHRRLLDADRRQVVDVEEAPVVDLLGGDAPEAQAVGLVAQQRLERVEAARIARRPFRASSARARPAATASLDAISAAMRFFTISFSRWRSRTCSPPRSDRDGRCLTRGQDALELQQVGGVVGPAAPQLGARSAPGSGARCAARSAGGCRRSGRRRRRRRARPRSAGSRARARTARPGPAAAPCRPARAWAAASRCRRSARPASCGRSRARRASTRFSGEPMHMWLGTTSMISPMPRARSAATSASRSSSVPSSGLSRVGSTTS